jgi:hypothetical protein
MSAPVQEVLPFGPVHNVGLFSSHWLEHRLELEPEWQELRDEASEVLKRLAELWKVERNRVERYGDEQGLEVGFIQPVLFALGWKLKYQTFVQGREPDYALFLDNAALDAALAAERKSPDFWTTAKVVADAKSAFFFTPHDLSRSEGRAGRKRMPWNGAECGARKGITDLSHQPSDGWHFLVLTMGSTLGRCPNPPPRTNYRRRYAGMSCCR